MYSNVSIPLGELVPNDCYHYEIYLTENSTNTDIAYVWGDYSTGQLIKSTNDKMYVNGADMLILKTLYLKYNEVYRVTITSYYGDYDSPTIKSIENLFIFLPSKTEISGDAIIGWVSGDNISDDTIQIIGNQNESTEQMLSLSGDSILVNLPSYTISGDSTENFFVFIINNIEEAFLSSGDEEIIIPILGENYVVSSADFNVIPSALVPFFTLFHWGWVGLMIMKDIRKMFENLKNGEFEKIASDDINANLV